MTVFFLPPLMKGLAMTAGLIVSIGAQNMFVLRQGLRREHVGPIVLFCAACDSALVFAGVYGLGAMLALVPGLTVAFSLGGAAFLLWYAFGAFGRALRRSKLIISGAAPLSLGAAIAATAGFTLLNPHVYIDTVMLMGAVGSALPKREWPYFVLGAATFSFIWFAAIGFGARLLMPVFAQPIAWRALDAVNGLMMTALALGLLLELRP